MPFTPQFRLLHIHDLVDRGLRKTPGAVRTAYYRLEQGELPPDALPPRLKIPGSRSIQVAEEDFLDWIDQLRQKAKATATATATAPASTPARRRGRPRKAETLARVAAAAQAGKGGE